MLDEKHPAREWEVADLLAIPYERVQQACLPLLAWTVGADFRAARRPSVDDVVCWDRRDARLQAHRTSWAWPQDGVDKAPRARQYST